MKKLLSICLKGFLVLIASLFLFQGVARAHLYGVSYGDPNVDYTDTGTPICSLSRLYIIDPNTGLWTGVGDIIGEANSDNVVGYWGVPGIDFHPVTGELYGIGFRCDGTIAAGLSNPFLITINPCTGYVTNEQSIDIGDLEANFLRFTDISFQSDGTLFAFYLFDPNTNEGAVAKIDLGDGDAEAVGEGTGSIDIDGGGISFLYDDPNNGTLYQAESSMWPLVPFVNFEANLNELDPNDGDIKDSDNLEFHSPIADGDYPTIRAMDSQPGTGMLYAAISFNPYTEITGAPERWVCGNYLATVDEGTGDVKVIGCLFGEFPGVSVFLQNRNIQAIAFAPLPVADAGWDFSVEQSSWDGATVCLDGSGSKDYIDCCGDPLLYIWSWLDANTTDYLYGKTPCVVLPLGTHEIDLTVDNCNGTDCGRYHKTHYYLSAGHCGRARKPCRHVG